MSSNERYDSVLELLKSTTGNDDLVDEVEDRIARRRLIKHLIAHRVKNDLSQADVAKRLGCSQSKISKLENSGDSEVRIFDLTEYAEAVGMQLRLGLAPSNQTAVEEIKYHAFRIKALLSYLVDLAEGDPQIAEGIAKFALFEAWAVGEVAIIPPVTDTVSRDPENPCDHWQKYEVGDMRGDCPGDGHYRCPECREWEGAKDE